MLAQLLTRTSVGAGGFVRSGARARRRGGGAGVVALVVWLLATACAPAGDDAAVLEPRRGDVTVGSDVPVGPPEVSSSTTEAPPREPVVVPPPVGDTTEGVEVSATGGGEAVPDHGFVSVELGPRIGCGLRTGGEAECWGARDADARNPVAAPPPGPFTAIRVGRGSVCGLRPGGDMACWGTYSGGPTPAPGGAFTAVIAGDADIPTGNCGLRTGGLIACATADDDWTTHFPDWSSYVPDGAFSAVSAWDEHFCGLRPDGEAVCWHATAATWHEPTPPGPFIGITVGNRHACGLRPDGTAECWTSHWPPGALPAYPPSA